MKKCGECKFWYEGEMSKGDCHRYPLYQKKGNADWCGEFVTKQKKGEESNG